MKYGRLVFATQINTYTTCNIGDYAQTFAIDLIYKKMNIPSNQIINILIDDLSTYSGETVILPINGFFLYRKNHPAFPTSPNIIPIFLGIYTSSSPYLKNQSFWNKYSPIGCRDESTFITLKKYGYDAYLNGCMTMIYPKRDFTPSIHKVFFVDAYEKVLNFVPKEILENAEFITHDITVDSHNTSKEEIIFKTEETSKKIYSRYYNEATLVVTSRLHCAAPCIAMGIPTIVVKNGFDDRFGWLDKYIKLYTPDEFSEINWNPEPIDIESTKELLLQNAINMINQSPNTESISSIHNFYMNRQRKKLSTPFMIKAFLWMGQYFPHTAGFIRDHLLKSFTIVAHTQRNIHEK